MKREQRPRNFLKRIPVDRDDLMHRLTSIVLSRYVSFWFPFLGTWNHLRVPAPRNPEIRYHHHNFFSDTLWYMLERSIAHEKIRRPRSRDTQFGYEHIYDAIYGRLHGENDLFTTVSYRITWTRITERNFPYRIRSNTSQYRGRIRGVYTRKRLVSPSIRSY